MTVKPMSVKGLGAACLLLALAHPARASETGSQWHPTLNFNGVTGLIDMPTGQSQPDGQLSFTTSLMGNINRTTLSFQIAPRLSGSFRIVGNRDLNYLGFDDYYDRSFDLRYRVLDEGDVLPSVVVGLQDFAGTGLFAGEYIAASKHLQPNLVVSGGLGWGRLGSYNAIGSPFGTRPPVDVGRGGKPDFDQYFRGPAAFFGGIEWQPTDKLGFKVEYSSDDYAFEEGQGIFTHKSPWNFGVEYQATDGIRLGAYYLYGSELGVTAQFSLNPKVRPGGGDRGQATYPVEPRPSRTSDPEAWSQDWALNPDAPDILRANTAKTLKVAGLGLEAMEVGPQRVQLWIRNDTYDAEAQAIGRAARVLTRTMPASVETFEIVPVVEGMPLSKVVLRRADVEAFETAPNGAARLRQVARIEEAGARPVDLRYADDLYPKFSWGLSPYLVQELFDAEQPYRFDLALSLGARLEIGPGWVLSGAASKRVTNMLTDDQLQNNDSLLPHVRSDGQRYTREGDPAVENLTLAWYSRPAPNLYGRVSAGYLERMFGGLSAELLWKPMDSRLALGGEVNYARQRDFSGMGFQDYDVVSGHASAYYDFGRGYKAQLDAGRYLAGDWGATLTIDREFANGWTIGAFATLTDASAEEFGDGSFDKGIRITMPLAWALGKPSRQEASATIRPFLRDGGARLDVGGRLYETVTDYHESGFDAQWGRVWR